MAILLVIAAHQHYRWPVLQSLAPYGGVGVHLFFALSGLLITYRLLEESDRHGGVSWRAFYARRFFRIIPAAFAYLAVVAWLLHPGFRQILAAAFFWRNYLVIAAEAGWYTGHFWSLSVEEHYYLLWPALLAIAGLARGAWLAPLLAIGVAIWRGLDEHYAWIASLQPGLQGSVWRTDYRLDGLLWGCAMAYLWHRYRLVLMEKVQAWHLAALIAGLCSVLAFPFAGSMAVFALLMSLVPVLTLARPLRWLEFVPLRWIGRISYGIYLWQQLFSPLEKQSPVLGAIQVFPWNIFCMFGIAAVSYYGMERPLMRFGRSWPRTGRPALPNFYPPKGVYSEELQKL